jgi:hypothetical protein
MSDQETTRQVEHLNNGDSRDDLSKLSELARKAFEQQRTTDCLDLTRAILLIDPENSEAQALRNSMRIALHQDLEKARALFRPAETPSSSASGAPISGTRIDIATTPGSAPGAVAGESLLRAEESLETVPMFREALAQRQAESPQKWRPGALDVAATLVVIALAIAAVPMYRSLSNPVTPAAAESSVDSETVPVISSGLELSSPQAESAIGSGTDTEPVPPFPAFSLTPTPDLVASQPADARPTAVTAPAAAQTATAPGDKTNEPIVRPPLKGTLAVSAPVATEIYVEDRHLGSAPASLQLSAGTHTLEYRHGALRKSVAHVIRPGETTLATILFDISVSINANPWANVYLDGAQRKQLGQTPLSGVQLPVGSMLIFENPKFEPKRYRITGSETGIQIVFP